MKNMKADQLRRMYYDEKKTLKEIGSFYNVSASTVVKRMDKCGLKRRGRSEVAYLHYNKTECFNINVNGKELLKNIGLALYWYERTNYKRNNKKNGTLAFTNSNLNMLKIWLKFLRDICNLKEEKIRARIYVHKNQNGPKLKRYWSRKLGVPLGNFENVSYTKKNSLRPTYKGTVKIKVHNIKLFDIIKDMISEMITQTLNKS